MKKIAYLSIPMIFAWCSLSTAQEVSKSKVFEYTRCKKYDDNYFDLKTADHLINLEFDKSECSKPDGQVKVSLRNTVMLFRGGMTAAISAFGLFNPKDKKFVPFKEDKTPHPELQKDSDILEKRLQEQIDDFKKQLAVEQSAKPPQKDNIENLKVKIREGEAAQKKETFIGKVFTASIPVATYACNANPPPKLSGEVWLEAAGPDKNPSPAQPYENTFVTKWEYTPDPSLPDEQRTKINLEFSINMIRSTYQHIIPKSMANQMENRLINPLDYRPCYQPPQGSPEALKDNLNDIRTYIGLNSSVEDEKEIFKSYYNYLKSNNICIVPPRTPN